MTPDELLTYWRAQQRDQKKPYLWTDEEVYVYMADAQRMFCRFARGIADSTSNLCTIDISAGQQEVNYDPRILKVRYAELLTAEVELTLVNIEALQRTRLKDDYGHVAASKLALETAPSIPKQLVTGYDDAKFFLNPPSAEADTLHLAVYRLPLEDITPDGAGEFEIPSQHHMHLALWMHHLAYSRQDVDTYDAEKAKGYEQRFVAYCFKARQEYDRREHTFRTVGYGGL